MPIPWTWIWPCLRPLETCPCGCDCSTVRSARWKWSPQSRLCWGSHWPWQRPSQSCPSCSTWAGPGLAINPIFFFSFMVKSFICLEGKAMTFFSSVPSSNSLVSVSGLWRAFWADTGTFKGPRLTSCVASLTTEKQGHHQAGFPFHFFTLTEKWPNSDFDLTEPNF